jgi:very-short-patch-repair endonuclease
VAWIAGRAHGVVARAELLAAAVSRDEIAHRIGTGALIVEFPGVYRVGHRAPSVEARYTAAVKACGEGAVLSGLAAAYLWGLVRGKPPSPQVTAPRERRVKGLKTRRRRRMDPRDATSWRAIPITTVPRTVIDLSSVLSLDELALACHEAGVRYRTTPAQVEARMGPREEGAKKLRAVLRGDAHVTLSRMERRFLKLLRAEGLPLPITNRPAGAHYVDCRWPHDGLTVELDSYTYHASRHAWEQDHRRDREARARGDEIRRYTWTDVFHEREPMLAELRALLATAART